MKKYLIITSLMVSGVLLGTVAWSQDDSSQQQEEIIIRKKGDFPKDMTIQLNGEQVTINGKKPEDVEGNIEVIRRKSSGGGEDDMFGSGQSGPFSSMPPGFSFSQSGPSSANRALLGVLTIPDDSSEGARIEEVEKGTPADSAGLQKGDVITKIDESDIHSAEDLTEAIGRYNPGDQIKVTYLRGQKPFTANVQLGKNDNNGFGNFGMGGAPHHRFHFQGPFGGGDRQNFMQQFRNAHPFMREGSGGNGSPRLGMSVESNNEGNGVTVTDVQSGSPADKSGFKAGDVISKFGGEDITGVDDIRQAIRTHQDDHKVEATVIRDGKTRSLDVEMPQKHERADL